MSSPRRDLIVIAGPTASGKTDLSLKIAAHYQTEIVSADSRQCFRELKIGTAKPTEAELALIPHHFINSHSISETFSAGQFAVQAREVLNNLFSRHHVVVVVGGTGLYLKALTEGLDDIPDVSPEIRAEINLLYHTQGMNAIRNIVRENDPMFYGRMDVNNPARMIRAAEIIKGTGLPYTHFLKNNPILTDFSVHAVVMNLPREELYHRINLRVDEMMKSGLLKETEELYEYRNLPALKTVGYSELFDYINGICSLEVAISKIKQHSRNYAKRQLTWFRNQGNYQFLDPERALDILVSGDNRK